MRISLPAIGALLLLSFGMQQIGNAQTLPSDSAPPLVAQNGGSAASPRLDSTIQPHVESTTQPHEDKRAYGVLPNYRTAEADVPFARITARQKLSIGVKDSFDGVAYPLAGFFSGIAQLSDQNPSFGQGTEGFAKRYGTAFADQVMGNLFTESLLPITLHQDPRFFRRGSGKFWGRVAYAATRVLICKNDSGRNTFNSSELLGNGIGASIANMYYPDSRGWSPTFTRMATAIGTDSFANVLKEFWPDVKRHYQRKHREKLEHELGITPVAAAE